MQFTREDVPSLQGTGSGVEYWREGLERRMPRYWELSWRGRVLLRVRSDHNERAYWRRRRDLIRLINETKVAGLLPQLHRNSKVLEPGCNVGQNLWEISQRWNCEIYGLDIDREVLDQAAKRRWRKPAHFLLGNVLEPSTFEKFADRQFDLVFTRWHLIHVPSGEAKHHYLRELKRIREGRADLRADVAREDRASRVAPSEHVLPILGRLGGVVRPQAIRAEGEHPLH
jgi:hypothetical protein